MHLLIVNILFSLIICQETQNLEKEKNLKLSKQSLVPH